MRKDSGFSLMELMTAIAILAILAAIAIPNYIGWLPNYRLRSAARDVFSNFQKAKMEAVKRNAPVVLAFNPDPANSYVMFIDDGAGAAACNFTLDVGEVQLGTYNMPNSVTLNSATFTGGTQEAGFNGRGLPINSRTGNVVFQNTNGRSYTVTLSIAGGIRLQ